MTHLDADLAMVPGRRFRRNGATKRAFDVLVSLMLVPIIAPIVAILFLIARYDGGPALFAQKRVGRDGRMFRCWKIRTMVVDAEAQLERHLREDPVAAAEWARDQKLTIDPRVTPVGRFLRETSLDELPQIFNVLRGDMSLVGPRPVTEGEFVRYAGNEWAYKAVRPGITGIWQVSGRNDVDYPTRVRMDVEYARTRSLGGDVAIILKTAGAVLGRTGR